MCQVLTSASKIRTIGRSFDCPESCLLSRLSTRHRKEKRNFYSKEVTLRVMVRAGQHRVASMRRGRMLRGRGVVSEAVLILCGKAALVDRTITK